MNDFPKIQKENIVMSWCIDLLKSLEFCVSVCET